MTATKTPVPAVGTVFTLQGVKRRVVAVRPFASAPETPVVWHAKAAADRRAGVEWISLSDYAAL